MQQVAAAIAAMYGSRKRERPLAVEIRDRLGQWLADEDFADTPFSSASALMGISARSQYPPMTGTTSSSTNFRTVMKCNHCSPVNCSRTEKKSVPSASPRCVLVSCVIIGSPRR